MRHPHAICIFATLVAACGGGQTRLAGLFSTDWQDDGGAGARAVMPRVLATPIPAGAAIAVGATDGALYGVSLTSGTTWTFAHPIDSRPYAAGSVVVGTGRGELFALDAPSGRLLWTKKAAGALRGAGDDGRTTVVSLATAGDGSVLLAVSHDGAIVRQLESTTPVGIPAVVGNYAFFPWQSQYVTIYNMSTGVEEGRLLFREQVSRAFTYGGKLYFGELGLFRYDDQIWRSSAQKASHLSLTIRDLPGDPKWFVPGAEVHGINSDARDKIALYAAPSRSGSFTVDTGDFVATYYKVAVGFNAKSGDVAWAAKHDASYIGGSPFEGGVALCDEEGKVTALDASAGRVAFTRSLGAKIKSCAVQADDLKLSVPAADTNRSLVDQLAEAIDLNENEMVAIQKVLLRKLAKSEDPAATKALIKICSSTRTSPALLPDAEGDLAARRNGAEFMIEALSRHYDFLNDVLQSPPVGPIADALRGMKDSRGAPALVAHLFDPADTTNAIKRAAAALADIATPTELPQLRSFFALYRTTADDDDIAQAVVSVAEALVKLGGVGDKALVGRAAEDPLTIAGIKTQLAGLTKGK